MIARDGTCTSLWQAITEPYIPANKADGDITYDVVLIGGGITGISTAWLLQQAGKNCLVIEARNIGFGTTGGTTAHLNTLLDTPYADISKNFGEDSAKLVARAAREAIELVKKNSKDLSIDCGFKDMPAFVFAQTQEQANDLDDIYLASAKAGLQLTYTNRIPVPIPFKRALIVRNQASFNPMPYVYALATAFEKAGGTILQDTRVTGVEEDEILTVTTSSSSFRARAVVFATHIPIGINLLHLRCAPYRSYAMAVRLMNKKDYPKGLIYDSEDPYHYYRSQEINGVTYLIAGGYDHRTADEENTENRFLQLEAYLRRYYNIKEIKYTWSSQYFEPADGLPYIGSLPGHTGNIFTATGFGGNGMVYSSVAAIILKSMITGEPDPYKGLFNPNRIKPVAGFVNFIKHNSHVAFEILSKIVPAAKMTAFVEMAPGEGKVAKYDGQTIAIHKDEHGNLHALHPECTHMKCTIAWNTAENSWDCPCHGARFDINGEVLTGPAANNLQTIHLD